jgi:hypothetical protein
MLLKLSALLESCRSVLLLLCLRPIGFPGALSRASAAPSTLKGDKGLGDRGNTGSRFAAASGTPSAMRCAGSGMN